MSYQGEDMTAYGLVNFDSALLSKVRQDTYIFITALPFLFGFLIS